MVKIYIQDLIPIKQALILYSKCIGTKFPQLNKIDLFYTTIFILQMLYFLLMHFK